LADCCVGGKSIAIVTGAENGGLRSVDIVAFVKLSFEIRHAYHNRYIVPYIAFPELKGFAHKIWGTNSSSMCFTALNVDDSFALEAIEILGEAPAVGFEIVTLDSEHKDSVDFIEGVQET